MKEELTKYSRWNTSTLQTLLETLDNQDSSTGREDVVFYALHSKTTRKNFPIAILTEEIKPVVIERWVWKKTFYQNY